MLRNRAIAHLICTLLAFTGGLSAEKPLILGIADGSGSGKPTIAKKIRDTLNPDEVVVISQDCYYRDQSNRTVEQRDLTNFDHPNSLDFELLCQHLIALKAGETVSIPSYNFATHCREAETTTVEPKRVIIVEGILLFAVEQVRDLLDIKIFVDAEEDIRLLRRIERDVTERGRSLASIRDQYLTTVKPMYAQFVEPSKQYADLIIPRGGYNHTAVDVIVSHIQRG